MTSRPRTKMEILHFMLPFGKYKRKFVRIPKLGTSNDRRVFVEV